MRILLWIERMLRAHGLLMLVTVRDRAEDCEFYVNFALLHGATKSPVYFRTFVGLAVPSLERDGLCVQAYKITPPELRIGSIADAILCRIAASHC